MTSSPSPLRDSEVAWGSGCDPWGPVAGDFAIVLRRLGQVATRAQIERELSRTHLDRALADGAVAEADSFAWHGSRPGLVRDAQRYNRLTVAGWWVLRFTWDEVVLRPEVVSRTLQEATERRTKGPLKGL